MDDNDGKNDLLFSLVNGTVLLNCKLVPMGGEISAGDLLTMHKLKNTDATFRVF